MARPFYPHEADDPDLDWLVSNFLYERSEYIPIECGLLPLILLPFADGDDARVTKSPQAAADPTDKA